MPNFPFPPIHILLSTRNCIIMSFPPLSSVEFDPWCCEPTEEQMEKARAREEDARKKSRKSGIFQEESVEEASRCTCGCCRGEGGERPSFCCRSLWSKGKLTPNGHRMRDRLAAILR